MTAIGGALAWLASVLLPDATLSGLIAGNFFYSMAPAGTPYPYLLAVVKSYREVGNSANGELGAGQLFLMLKVVSEGDSVEVAEQVMQRVKALIHNQKGTAEGVTVLSCVRQGFTGQPEVDNGRRYNHYGYDYMLFVSEGD